MGNNLRDLVKKIQKTKKQAEQKIPEDSASAARIIRGRAKRAREDLKSLYLEYRKNLLSRSIIMLVTGDQSQKFAEIASQEYMCFSRKADTFYDEILKQIAPRLYTNTTSSASLFDNFAAKFEDRALDIDIISYPALLYRSKFKKELTGYEDALNLMKRAFNEEVGGEIIALDMIEHVSKKAVNDNYDQKFCAMIMYTDDTQLIEELKEGILRGVTKNVFILTAGKAPKEIKKKALIKLNPVNKESVEKALITVKSKLI